MFFDTTCQSKYVHNANSEVLPCELTQSWHYSRQKIIAFTPQRCVGLFQLTGQDQV